MAPKTGLSLLKKSSSIDPVNNVAKGFYLIYSGGIIISTPKLTLKLGLNRSSKSSSKLTKNGAIVGKTFPNFSPAGIFKSELRTDNTIKNHFYSTLRRSLRRINKILGNKNSTNKMRRIKPLVLSQIMQHKELPKIIFRFGKLKPTRHSKYFFFHLGNVLKEMTCELLMI